MSEIKVNTPDALRIPKSFQTDREVMAFFRQQQIVIKDLYRRLGGKQDRVVIIEEAAAAAQEAADNAEGLATTPAAVGAVGVVMQAASVNPPSLTPAEAPTESAVASTAPTTPAPAAYDQSQIQQLVEAIEDLKAKQSQVVVTIDDVKTTATDLVDDISDIDVSVTGVITTAQDSGQMAIP